MPTPKIKMRYLAHYLLVFIATTGGIGSKSSLRSSCPGGTIEKKKLKIEETPVNFRNSSGNGNGDNDKYEKQMLMRLAVSKNVKECMDSNKFILTINLDKPISDDHLKVGSTATQHIVTVAKDNVRIESCFFDENKISDEYFMLLNVLGIDNKEKQGIFQELISFMAPSELSGLKKNIKDLKIDFEDEDRKKTCETYRGVSVYLFCSTGTKYQIFC